jgi:ComF family protein
MLRESIKTTSSNIMTFLYPELCVACGENLAQKGEELCLKCQIKIPKTDFHTYRENPFFNRIRDRFPLEFAAAYYLFTQSGATQALIHAIKYEGKYEAAIFIGENYGKILADAVGFHDIDAIVPVPMHPAKQRIRGYNQAEAFGNGLAVTMDKPLINNAVIKTRQTISQTRKNRFGRLENVSEVFQLGKNAKQLENKHVLLVDDVLTTGATLEASALPLLEIPGLKLSIATIAMAGR